MAKNRRHDIVKPSKFKTSMCSFYLSPEGCPFGERCAFAHGADELRCEGENSKKQTNVETSTDAPTNVDNGCPVSDATQVESLCSGGIGGAFHKDVPAFLKTVSKDHCNNSTSCGNPSASLEGTFVKKEVITKDITVNNDATAGKGVKPPPKISKGKCLNVDRKVQSSSKGKTTDNHNENASTKVNGNNSNSCNGNNNNQRRTAPQYHGRYNCHYMDATRLPTTLSQFSSLPPGTVLLPFSTAMPSYVSASSGSIGASPSGTHVMCFGPPASASPYGSGDNLATLHHASFSGYPLSSAHCGHDGGSPGGNHAHHQHHQHHLSFAALMSSPVPPTVVQIPITATPLHRGFMWANQSDSVAPLSVPKLSEETFKKQEKLFDVKAHGTTPFVSKATVTHSAASDDDSSAVAAEWAKAIEKWLKYQTDENEAESECKGTECLEAYCSAGSTSCCCGKTVETEGVVDRISVGTETTFPVASGSWDEKRVEKEEYAPETMSNKKEPTLSLESDHFSKRTMTLSKEVDEASDRMKLLGDASTNTTAITTPTTTTTAFTVAAATTPEEEFSKEDGSRTLRDDNYTGQSPENAKSALSAQKIPCKGCIHCMPHLYRKRRPIMTNHFHSSCTAACHSIFLYFAEKNTVFQIVDNDMNGKKLQPSESNGRGAVKNPTSSGDFTDYCI